MASITLLAMPEYWYFYLGRRLRRLPIWPSHHGLLAQAEFDCERGLQQLLRLSGDHAGGKCLCQGGRARSSARFSGNRWRVKWLIVQGYWAACPEEALLSMLVNIV